MPVEISIRHLNTQHTLGGNSKCKTVGPIEPSNYDKPARPLTPDHSSPAGRKHAPELLSSGMKNVAAKQKKNRLGDQITSFQKQGA